MSEETFIKFWIRDATQILLRYLFIAGSAFILFYIFFKETLWFRKIQKKLIRKWINSSVAHNLHHKKFNGNYSLYFLF